MAAFDNALDWFGRWLAHRLRQETPGEEPYIPSDPEALRRALRPADVVLVAGGSKLSTAIKYLTQSTWSHAAIYVGDAVEAAAGGAPHPLIEVTPVEGCVAVPLSKYERFHTRICRPVGLTDADREEIVAFMVSRIGAQYDMRNIFDLLRYLMPTPPVPARWRRRMIAMGSGEPTRAICSSLIAEAFGRVHYPILPRVEAVASEQRNVSRFRRREILHIRHYSLYAPADFDLSPYFRIVKPTIEEGFNYKGLTWAEGGAPPTALATPGASSIETQARGNHARMGAHTSRELATTIMPIAAQSLRSSGAVFGTVAGSRLCFLRLMTHSLLSRGRYLARTMRGPGLRSRRYPS